MDCSITGIRAMLAQGHQLDHTPPGEMAAGTHITSSRLLRKVFNLGFYFLCGAALLVFLATWQKLMIGAPLVTKGYIVPFVFGGLSGACVGHYITRLQCANAALLERVGTLESIISLCAECGKVRKPEADSSRQDFWQPMETYLSEHTGCSFSHGICPECMRKMYPNEAESVLHDISRLYSKEKHQM